MSEAVKEVIIACLMVVIPAGVIMAGVWIESLIARIERAAKRRRKAKANSTNDAP